MVFKSVLCMCTGQKRDNETGLDYFGARYFSSTLGRFTRPDPLYSSGRPANPQTWNRYAYALNNPLRYTDPFGLWEWDTCEAGDSVCEEWKTMFEAGIADARKAAISDKLTAAQQADLKEVLDYLGIAGDGNGVKISFGNIDGMTQGKLIGANQIKIDMAQIIKASNQEYFGYKYNLSAENGGVAVHEGRHGRNGDHRLPYPNNEKDIGPMLGALYGMEMKAYNSQSYVFKGLGVSTGLGHFHVWDIDGHNAADMETLRSIGVINATGWNIRNMEETIKEEIRNKK